MRTVCAVLTGHEHTVGVILYTSQLQVPTVAVQLGRSETGKVPVIFPLAWPFVFLELSG